VNLALAILTAVTLAWDPNSEPDVAGYRLYYGTNGFGTVVNCGNVTNYTLNLGRGVWSFYATCYNTSGLESEPSNVVTWTNGQPSPPVVTLSR
jgi:chitinase